MFNHPPTKKELQASGYFYRHAEGAPDPKEIKGDHPVLLVDFPTLRDVIKVPSLEQAGTLVPFRFVVIITYIGKDKQGTPLIKITTQPQEGLFRNLLGVKIENEITLRERLDRAAAHMLTSGVIPGSTIAVQVTWTENGPQAHTFAGFIYGTDRFNKILALQDKERLEAYLFNQPFWKYVLGTLVRYVDKKAPPAHKPIPTKVYDPWAEPAEVGQQSPTGHALNVMTGAVIKAMFAVSQLPSMIENATHIVVPTNVTVIPMNEVGVSTDAVERYSSVVSMNNLTRLDGSDVDEGLLGRFAGIERTKRVGAASETLVPTDLEDLVNPSTGSRTRPLNLAERHRNSGGNEPTMIPKDDTEPALAPRALRPKPDTNK